MVQQGQVLKKYTGHKVKTYITPSNPAGLYTVEVGTTKSDSVIKILTTTTIDSGQPYPLLPADHNVSVVRLGRNSVYLAWKPSPSKQSNGKPMEYCVSVNRMRNFNTECDALAHIHGDERPTVPPYSGFGFKWEKDKLKELRHRARPVKGADPNDVRFICIGKKTRYAATQLLPGLTYYFDVFAIEDF